MKWWQVRAKRAEFHEIIDRAVHLRSLAELRRSTAWQQFAEAGMQGSGESPELMSSDGASQLHAWYGAPGGTRGSGRLASMESGFGASASFGSMLQVSVLCSRCVNCLVILSDEANISCLISL